MVAFLTQGVGFHDLALLLLRFTLGFFFLLARFRWVWDPAQPMIQHKRGVKCVLEQDAGGWFPEWRHKHLQGKLSQCGYSDNRYLAGFVAMTELSAALGLIVGLLTPLAALGLVGVLIFATRCTAREKVAKQGPVDCIDWVCDYLWLVEPVYLVIALSLVLTGAGRFSLDHALLIPLLKGGL